MTVATEDNVPTRILNSPTRVRMRMLEQMAEALEDQVAALYRRAAAFEEEEFLINREVDERQTEINRLMMKLESMRAERDRTMERTQSLSREAAAMREQVVNAEEEAALAAIEDSEACPSISALNSPPQTARTGGDSAQGAMFFRRMIVAEAVTRPLTEP